MKTPLNNPNPPSYYSLSTLANLDTRWTRHLAELSTVAIARTANCNANLVLTPSIPDWFDGNKCTVVLEPEPNEIEINQSNDLIKGDEEELIRAIETAFASTYNNKESETPYTVRIAGFAPSKLFPAAVNLHSALIQRGYEVEEDPDAVMVRLPSSSTFVGGAALPLDENVRVELLDLAETPVKETFEIHFKGTPYEGDDTWFRARHERTVKLSGPGTGMIARTALVCIKIRDPAASANETHPSNFFMPIAYVSLYTFEQDNRTFVGFVGTHPDHRRKGYARLALQKAIEACGSSGEMWLTVVEDHVERFYCSLGFRNVGKRWAGIYSKRIFRGGETDV